MSIAKRFFAWMLQKGDSLNHRLYDVYKKDLFRDVQGLVIEVGPGTGVNFNYVPRETEWLGIEPNEAFHDMLLAKAKENGINARLLSGEATLIPLPDNSADAVLCTLVLCSVANQTDAIAEMKRVLKPGGKLIFIEHVAAPEHSKLRFAQNVLNPLNNLIADGCNCNRETWTSLQNGGFARVEISNHRINGALLLHAPHVMGFAMK